MRKARKSAPRSCSRRESPPDAPKGGKVKLAPISRIFRNQDFGYRTITVERPLRDEPAKWCWARRASRRASRSPTAALRDTENVPLAEDVRSYFKREVLPHAPDAWIDHDKTKVGYEIPFNRHFYVFEPPRQWRRSMPNYSEQQVVS